MEKLSLLLETEKNKIEKLLKNQKNLKKMMDAMFMN